MGGGVFSDLWQEIDGLNFMLGMPNAARGKNADRAVALALAGGF